MVNYTEEEAEKILREMFADDDTPDWHGTAERGEQKPPALPPRSAVPLYASPIKFDISPWPLLECAVDALHVASDRIQELKRQVEEEAENLDRARKRYEFEVERLKSLNGIVDPIQMEYACDRWLPLDKRDKFRSICLGEPMEDKELENLANPWNYVTVGDTVSETFYRHGVTPALSIFDGRTQRADTTAFYSLVEGKEMAKVCNPPGMLTEALFTAIDIKITNLGGLILVDGEEDLAVLPCIALAPEGYTVVYGDPGKGMVKVAVNDASRRRAQELMNEMECLEGHENVRIYREMKKRLEGRE